MLARATPVRFVQDDHLVPSGRQRCLLLCEHLYFVTYHVDAPTRQSAYLSQAAGTVLKVRRVSLLRSRSGQLESHKRAAYRSSDAFSSRTASLYAGPSRARARAHDACCFSGARRSLCAALCSILVLTCNHLREHSTIFCIRCPGLCAPSRIKIWHVPSSATTCSLATASLLPTISLISCGRYFST